MANSILLDLITAKTEELGVEYKAWLDTGQPEVRAKLARHLAALANHGGGYLVFGIDDVTKNPQGASSFELSTFGQDAISGIIKRYLEPRFQVVVEHVDCDGSTYPVITVPGHGARPVIATADGPRDEKGRTVGVRQGAVYVRAAGPESVEIKSADDWTALLERCLTYRADLLGKIFRQSLAASTQPSRRAADLLTAALEDTAADFSEQTAELAEHVQSEDQRRIRAAGENFVVLGYVLIDADGEPMSLDNIAALNERVAIGMHQWAYTGWAPFLPLTVPERAPRLRMGKVFGNECTYLEGMRLVNTAVVSGSVDYWRIYDCGPAIYAESFHEDYASSRSGLSRHLRPVYILELIHSVLAHARLMGQELPGAHQVTVRMDWRGLSGRRLMWDDTRIVSRQGIRDDRFGKSISVTYAELRDDYFEAFRKVALPVLRLFADSGWFDPDDWLTRDAVRREFARMNVGTLKLFDDQ